VRALAPMSIRRVSRATGSRSRLVDETVGGLSDIEEGL